MTDYSELKRLAEAVMPDDASPYLPCPVAFMNAATPAVVLDLIAEIERLYVSVGYEEARFRLELGESERLRAENEALRKDAERYRWMRSSFVRNRKHSLVWYLPMMTPLTAEGLDENIDAAMSKGEQA